MQVDGGHPSANWCTFVVSEWSVSIRAIVALDRPSEKLAGSAKDIIEHLDIMPTCTVQIPDMKSPAALADLLLFGCRVDIGAYACLLYTSDAADEEDSVDLGGR